MEALDLGLKFHMITEELQQVFFWTSFMEIFVFIYAFCVFLTYVKVMAPIFCFTPHLIRAAIGFVTIVKMPQSRDLIQKAKSESNGTNPVQPHQFGGLIKFSAEKSLKHFAANTYIWLIIYFLLTLFCFIWDLVCFFIAVAWNSNEVYDWSYCVANMLTFASIFVTCDLFYIIWSTGHLIKLPAPYNSQVVLALLGFYSKLLSHFPKDPKPEKKPSSKPDKKTKAADKPKDQDKNSQEPSQPQSK